MGRTSGTCIKLDLTSQGNTAAVVAPGGNTTFVLPAPKLDARGNFPRAEGIVLHLSALITNSNGASVPIQADDLPRMVTSIRGSCPLLGMVFDPLAFNGPRAKLAIEYISQGYNFYGPPTEGVPQDASVQDYHLYIYLPFKNECFFSPLDFCPWVGWLTQFELQITLAASTVFASLSTGAVLGNVTINAWLEASPTKHLELPAFHQWRMYNPAAAGGLQALLQDVGQQGGLTCVQPGSRLTTIMEMCSLKGLGGAAVGTDYTSMSCDQLSQPVTQNVDSFLTEFCALSEKPMRSGAAVIDPVAGITLVVAEGASGPPYSMNTSAPPTTGSVNPANNAQTLYMPWRVPGKLAEIGSQPKFQGNLTFFRTFGTPPSSGNFPFLTGEIRQLSEASAASLLRTAGVDQARANGAMKSYYDGMPTRGASGFGIPIRIPNS